MALTRGKILAIGPVLLVTISYVIAAPVRAIPVSNGTPPAESEVTIDLAPNEPLSERCQKFAAKLRGQLNSSWNILVREPYVIGGDLSADELDQNYEQTIVPTSVALNESYFRSPPRHPITILICSSDERFRECNQRLEEQELSQFSGWYSRKHRRIIVNIASGDGTLAHELTHALAHADFATMPEWFDEGLASLHEECEFSDDGRRLIGNGNWRDKVAYEALNRGELRLIEDITSKRFGSIGRANLDYAHVRSLCLYLQERSLLEPFYRACRSNISTDPTGLRSLCEITGDVKPIAFDDAFRAWLLSRPDQLSK